MSPGEQLIDLVHIDDVVQAFLIAAGCLDRQPAGTHETYAVSSGSPLPLRQLVELYRQITGTDVRVHWGGRPYRPREVMVPWNAGKLLPGWQPRISLEEGLRCLR